MNKAQAAAYLAGMIDGEGHVSIRRNRSVSVSNTDWELIEAVVECCELLGLHQTVQKLATRPPRKPGWQVMITGKESLSVIEEIVPLHCSRKRTALAEAIATYKYKKRPPQEWLEQKYLVEGLTLQQVAEAWGVKNSVSAWCWMDFYGIPTRKPGVASTKYPPPSREWLQARVDEGLTLKQIGEHEDLEVATPLAAVWHWCKKFGIDRQVKEHKHG